MQWNIRAAPGILRRAQVISVGFAIQLEYNNFDFCSQGWLAGKPFGIRPGRHQSFGVQVTGFHLGIHIVESIKHQDSGRQGFDRMGSHRRIQQGHQSLYIVATQHGAQQLNRMLCTHQW